MTATALHILSSDDLAGPVSAAYESLNIQLRPIGAAETSARVVTVRPGSGWVSVFDQSDVFADLAALAEVAVELTRAADTVAVLTNVVDSDAFQLVLFDRGRQIDIVASEPTDDDARFAQLSHSERTKRWGELFPGATPAVLEAARHVDGPFAEDHLAAWCSAIGLDPARTTETAAEAASAPGGATRQAIVTGGSTRQASSPHLSFYPSRDDTPHLRVFPAAWPVAPGARKGFTWLILSANGGFDGLDCTLEMDPPDGVDIHTISLTALSFYNGQITSTTPLAVFEAQPADRRLRTIRVEPFAVPDVDPNSRKQIVILLRLEATVNGHDPVTIRPTVRPDASPSPLVLPPLRLQARQPAWQPLPSIIEGGEPPSSMAADAVLGLNQPSVRSFVAIHADLGQTFRDRVREWCADWIDSLDPDDVFVTVHTQKHMTASFRVSKSTKRMGARALLHDKLWPRLFRADDGYQTVRLTIEGPGYVSPIAGVTIQESLREDPAMTETLVDSLGSLLGSGTEPPDPAEVEQRTVAIAAWVLDHPDIDRLLGSSAPGLVRSADRWCEETGPLQAWVASSLWFPEFDLYDEYQGTLYEDAAAVDWFRSGARGALGTVGWTSRRLRFIAPHIWLGPQLAARIELADVERVAEVRRSARATAVSLRPEHTMGELEQALATILPGA